MRRKLVILVVLGALVVVLLGWRSFSRMMAQKTCALKGGHWIAAAKVCAP